MTVYLLSCPLKKQKQKKKQYVDGNHILILVITSGKRQKERYKGITAKNVTVKIQSYKKQRAQGPFNNILTPPPPPVPYISPLPFGVGCPALTLQ